MLETLWVRLMVLVFGSTTFAVSTVLTAFMAGLALGSWVAGRRAETWADPRRALVAYGLLELGIGLYALCLPWLTGQLHAVHAALWGTSHSSYHSFALLRFLLAGALLLLPTVAMGATLPILARFSSVGDPRQRPLGRQVGTLYAINTAGAVLGVFLAGFVLLPSLGVRTTNLCACLVDLCLAGVAFALWRASRRVTVGAAPPPAPDAAPSAALARLALISIAISGAVAMVLQVAWTRALSLIIGSSTYAFSLILVCFLIGLAGGAALYARRQARHSDQAGNLAVVHLLTALTALAGVHLMDRLPAVLLLLMQRIELAPQTVFLVKFVIAGAIIMLPTFFMGMVFPAVIQICSQKGSASAVTGRVYAVNTLGAIVGSFAGGFLLVPLVGLQPTMVFMVLTGLLLAGLFGLQADRSRTRIAVSAAVLASALAVLGLARPWDLEVMTAGVFRISRYQGVFDLRQKGRAQRGAESRRTGRLRLWRRWARRVVAPADVVDTMTEPTAGYGLVYHREGVTTTASLSRTVDLSISNRACWVRHALLVNGKPDASLTVLRPRPARGCQELVGAPLSGAGIAISPSGDAETQILSGLLPIILHDDPQRPPRDVLVIGWGSGITAGAALRGPVERLVAVELELAVVEAARHFEPHNHLPQRDPRLELVNEDGRNYLAASRRRFDVVISEPSNPWIAGCGNLFTREFFELVRSRLNRRGVYLQWLQAYEIAPLNVWSILGTMSDVFPNVHVFRPVQAGSDLLLVARKDDRPLSWRRLRSRLRHSGIRRELRQIHIGSPADLVARLLAGPEGVRRVSRGAPRNTDDNARIEFAAPRDLINYRRYSAGEITSKLGETLPDPLVVFDGAPNDAAGALCWARLQSGQVGRARGRSACAGVDAILGSSAGRLQEELVEAVARGLASEGELLDLVELSPHAALERANRTLPRPDPGLDPAADPGKDPAKSLDPAVDPPPDPGLDPARDPIRDPIRDPGLAEHYVIAAVLGHLEALKGDTYSAVLFLSAARRIQASTGLRYQPLDALLARQYLRAGHGARAVRIARSLVHDAARKP